MPDSLHNAQLYLQKGQIEKAAALCRQILIEQPENAAAFSLLASVHFRAGEYQKAFTAIHQAIQIKHNDPDLYQKKGDFHLLLEHPADAVLSYKKAIELYPDHLHATHNLGKALLDLGLDDQALIFLNKTVSLDPQYIQAYYNIGVLYERRHDLSQAIAHYQKAVTLKPGFLPALFNLGSSYQQMGNFDAAENAYRAILNHDPGHLSALNNLGTVMLDKGDINAAISCFRQVLAIDSNFEHALINLFDQLQITCNWEDLFPLQKRMTQLTRQALAESRQPAETPFLNLRRSDDPALNFHVARAHGKAFQQIVKYQFQNDRSRKKIRLGYLSNNFWSHAVSHIMLSIFEHHNRDDFELFCYSYGKNDHGFYRQKIKAYFDHFTDLSYTDTRSASDRIYQDNIDILVEMNGYTHGHRLDICAQRPAPIQVSYLGFLGTTGTDFIDYMITDPVVTPKEVAHFFTEKLVYLPYCYQVANYAYTHFQKKWDRQTAGLPESAFVFCSFNQSYKFEPIMFGVWMNILKKRPDSVLWLRKSNPMAMNNLRKEAENRGVNADRLIFSDAVDLGDHLERLRLADLALDTRIYNGGATTSNALWSGVPVISLIGHNFVSRMSASSLLAAGLEKMVVKDLQSYEQLALDLSENPGKLQKLRDHLLAQKKTGPVFDTRQFTKHLENGFRQIWQRYLAGEEPEQIYIKPASLSF